MKILIAYYSRMGITRKVAEYLSQRLGADIDEIIDLKDRKGPIGYLIAGKDAAQKRLTEFRAVKDPSGYDIIVIGTPVWAWNITPAVRAYISNHKGILKDKILIFFCTMGGSGDEQSFDEMKSIIGNKPKATLTLLTRDVAKGAYEEKIKDFVKVIRRFYEK